MKLNTKVRYGLRTMLEIASAEKNKGVFQKDISKNQKISEKYLDQIIASLKTAGLIINIGGKKSGYILKKPKHKITVYDVYRAFEPELSIVHCIERPADCEMSKECIVTEYWCGLNKIILKYLKDTTIANFID